MSCDSFICLFVRVLSCLFVMNKWHCWNFRRIFKIHFIRVIILFALFIWLVSPACTVYWRFTLSRTLCRISRIFKFHLIGKFVCCTMHTSIETSICFTVTGIQFVFNSFFTSFRSSALLLNTILIDFFTELDCIHSNLISFSLANLRFAFIWPFIVCCCHVCLELDLILVTVISLQLIVNWGFFSVSFVFIAFYFALVFGCMFRFAQHLQCNWIIIYFIKIATAAAAVTVIGVGTGIVRWVAIVRRIDWWCCCCCCICV